MKSPYTGKLLALTVLAMVAFPAPAAVAQADPADPMAIMRWREIGPAVVGGRVSDLAVNEADPRILYVGTATGGVWKTTNHGTTWEAVFTGESTASIGAITLAPSNPNIVWVGTGEPQNRQSSPWGDGVYKSTDGGRTWQHMGLRRTLHISRIRIHPRDPDIVYVAAVGGLWGPNPERGVFKTTDGGETWEHVLALDDDTGAIDLIMDPGDPNTLLAAMYQRRRTPWGFNGGGPGSGIYRTLNGGGSWERVDQGLPEGDLGRIGLDVYRRDGSLIYALVEGRRGTGLYRSKNRGDSWEFLSDNNPRPMYFSLIRIDPNNPERIYTGGQNLMRSDDGGRTFTSEGARNVHLDHHALWIDPSNSNHLLMGSDGGISTSWDGSETWRFYDNLPIAQFYEIGFDTRAPYWVCGGLQDNGSWCGPTNTLDNQGIRNADWLNVGGGDGFYVHVDPLEPSVLFSESQGGRLTRMDLNTGERASVAPSPQASLGEGAPPRRDRSTDDPPDEDERIYRTNWNTPVVMSSHDRNTIYFGAQMLMRSTDRGQSWEQISPDLTYDIDRATLEIMGELPSDSMVAMHDGTRTYSTLTTVGESPMNPDVIYTGSDDGRLMGTRDGGDTWSDLTPNLPIDLPDNTYVSRVVASNEREGRIYATFDGHQTADFTPYVYMSNDYGATWSRISSGLPNWSVNVFIEHPAADRLLFVGSEVGVFVSIDRGAHWRPLMNELPTVPVDDIKIHPLTNDLVIGTHGRGIWVMPDVSPLEALSRVDDLVAGPYLFPVQSVTDWKTFRFQEWTASAEFRLPNPEPGARIRYWLPDPGPALSPDSAAAPVEIHIFDSSRREVRTLEGPSTPGAHEVTWDLRIEPAYELEEGETVGRRQAGPDGPKVLPGVYQVELEVDGTTMSGDLVVSMDPRLAVSPLDLQARQTALMAIHGLQGPIHELGMAVRRIEGQLKSVRDLLSEAADTPPSIDEEVDTIAGALDDISSGMNRLGVGALRLSVEASTSRPTEDQLQGIDRAWADAPGVIERMNALITDRMPALYRMLDQAGVRADPGTAITVPRRGGTR